MRTKILISLTMAALLGLVPLRAIAADPQNDDLQTQVKALNERVAQLEKQLAEKNGPTDMTTPQYTAPTAIDHWDPFLQNMRAQLNQLFQDSFDRNFGPGYVNLMGPRADFKQTPNQYILTMDLPGMDKSNINVEVKGGMLVVSGDRTSQTETNQGNQGNQFFRQERSFGHFTRALPLPDDAKPDDVKADYKNGVLDIKVGRASGGKPGNAGGKKIQVE
jgi:HSP20 family protein